MRAVNALDEITISGLKVKVTFGLLVNVPEPTETEKSTIMPKGKETVPFVSLRRIKNKSVKLA